MPLSILSVGFEFPGGVVEGVELESDRSLLDADIIVFEPGIPHKFYTETFQGKPSLSDESSFRAREAIAHWRSEILASIEAGKLVVVFLAAPVDVYADTGQRQYSGTGRNARVTRIVDLLRSYDALPITAKATATSGTEIRPAGDLKFLATYWKEFGEDSSYEAFLEGEFTDVLLKTRSGDRVVGAAIRKGSGTLLLLPTLQYDYDSFVKPGTKKDTWDWTKEAIAYGNRLVVALVGIAEALREASEVTPPPPWSLAPDYRLKEEAVLEVAIAEKTRLLTTIQAERQELQRKLTDARNLRGLLYETGHPLQRAVLEALRLMGFTAEPYADGESEFDAVFTSPEGRFLGEVEGRDNRAINIDKLSQLERNLQEDFAREEVTTYAKGILFGNAYRLSAPGDRGPAFTDKCVAGASRLGVALVRTPDMFRPARYLKQTRDEAYARACREAIFRTSGAVVVFPEPPSDESDATVEDAERDDGPPKAGEQPGRSVTE